MLTCLAIRSEESIEMLNSFMANWEHQTIFINSENGVHSFISNISNPLVEVKLCRGRNIEEVG